MRIPRIGNRGFSALEGIVALSVVMTGVMTISAVFKTVRAVENPARQQYDLMTQVREVQTISGSRLTGYWLGLASNQCQTDGERAPAKAALSDPQAGLQLLDKESLDQLIPEKQADGKDNPLRKAIQSLIAAHGSQAPERCLDAALINNPDYAAIGKSTFGKTICRCASASTPYGTFAAPVRNLSSRAGLYACLLRRSDDKGAATPALILETFSSMVDVKNGKSQRCSDLSGEGDNPALLRRVNYLAVGMGAEALRIAGTYYVADGNEP